MISMLKTIPCPRIIIDIKIVPVDKDGVSCADFDADWEVLIHGRQNND